MTTLRESQQPVPAGTTVAGATTLRERAYEQILEMLRSGEIQPGAEITESQLTHLLAMTKSPVRSALARLCQEGWVLPLARRGHRVKPLTVVDVRDLFLMRKLVEPAGARLAAGNIDTAFLKKLDEACQRGFVAGNLESERDFFAANKAFHIEIVKAAGSPRLRSTVASLQDEAQRVLRFGMRYLDWSYDWAHGHDELLAALTNGDGPAAERIAMRQLETSERIVIEALRRQSDLIAI